MDSETKLRLVTREIWLQYINNYLFSNGMISEEMHDKMKIAINNKYRAKLRDKALNGSSIER